MPDISLRFHKDMLVLSAPLLSALARQGIDTTRDTELTLLLEPDTIEDAYKLESLAGAQCLVAGTASLTPARLAHVGMESRAEELASSALGAVAAFNPQHVFVELGPCGLPLDASSKGSLNENRDQYARFARLFAAKSFDAFFLNGYRTCADLKCALMGLRKVSDKPIFASVDVLVDGTLASGRGTLEEAVGVMNEFEASVAGFSTAAGQAQAVALARRVVAGTNLPVLAQLEVTTRDAQAQGAAEDNPYGAPDSMIPAAEALHDAGVQFLRATGDAVPAYTGALVATTMGLDVRTFVDAGASASASAGAVVGEGANASMGEGASQGAVVSGGAGWGAVARGETGENATRDADGGASRVAIAESESDAEASASSAASTGASDEEMAALIERMRARVSESLGR